MGAETEMEDVAIGLLDELHSGTIKVADMIGPVDSKPLVISIIIIIASILIFYFYKNRTEYEDISVGLSIEQSLSQESPSADFRVLNPATFKTFKLIKSTKASHNTKLLRFEIPPSKSIGLPIGRHISAMIHVDGHKIIRPYTPVSRPDEIGYFELLVKSYAFGKMSTHLCSLKIGDTLEVRGPVGRFKYAPNMYHHIGLICGGSGLTPCLQVIRCIFEGTDAGIENTKITLLYQNRTESDILLKDSLEELRQKHSERLSILYFLSDPSKDWGLSLGNERRGYIDTKVITDVLHLNGCDFVGVCGPSGFNEKMIEQLVDVGFEKEKNIYVW